MSEKPNEMQDASTVTEASDASEINELQETQEAQEGLDATEVNEAQEAQESGESPDAFGDQPALDIDLIKQVLETALLTSPEPLSLNDMKRMFPRGETNNELVRKLLDEIRASWEGRGVELVNVASGWRFRAKPELQRFLDKLNPQKAPKYSRAVMETLAIIAYRQPVTRGDIEDIRGVVVSSNIMKALEARGWIDVIGHREVPGRPAIFATTKQFLDDLSLRSLEELPALDDLGALVDSSGASQVELNMPEQGGGAISAGEGMLDDGDEPADELSLTGDDEPVADAAIMPPSPQIH
jgi:segregation and condensation protein B